MKYQAYYVKGTEQNARSERADGIPDALCFLSNE